MWTRAFWQAAAERSLKTAAQSLLSLWLVGDVAFNAFSINPKLAVGVALGGAVLSLLTSVASAPLSPAGTPSLVGEQNGVTR